MDSRSIARRNFIISEVVRLLRAKHKVSQEKFAGDARISGRTLSRLENGESSNEDTLALVGLGFDKYGEKVDLLDEIKTEELYERLKAEANKNRPRSQLEIISRMNLNESGEVSDERESLSLNELYVTRDCETKIVTDLIGTTTPLFLVGEAGSGKTAMLWRIATRLLANGADLFFFRADYLVSDEGFEEFATLPFAANKEAFLLVDTVDSIAGVRHFRQRFTQILDDCLSKGYRVLASIRPVEKRRYFPHEASVSIPEHYSDGEFQRAVESYVKAFYRLSKVETIEARVSTIRSIVSVGTPVSELAFNPLTMRMLFAVYAPNEIPKEVNSTSLYLEFWRRRVETDLRAGQTQPEPGALNLGGTASWFAETMLIQGTVHLSRDHVNLAGSDGRISRGDVAALVSRGILHPVTTSTEHDGYEFFHQTFFEFVAGLSLAKQGSGIGIDMLFRHLKDNPFDSLRIPIFQNALALGQMTASSSKSLSVLAEILERRIEFLLVPALFAIAQLPTVSERLHSILAAALNDRKNMALYIRLSSSTPKDRLPAVWRIFRKAYEDEREERPLRNPRTVRAALSNALPRIVSRVPELSDEILDFFRDDAIVDDVSLVKDNSTSIELIALSTTLLELVSSSPSEVSALFIRLASALSENAKSDRKDILLRCIAIFCHSPRISVATIRAARQIAENVEGAKAARVVAFLWSRELELARGRDRGYEFPSNPIDVSEVRLLQVWSRGKPLEIWRTMLDDYIGLTETPDTKGEMARIWAEELWERLDQHPMEVEQHLSARGFEFLSTAISEALESNDPAARHFAADFCSRAKSIGLLCEIYRRTDFERMKNHLPNALTDIFLPAKIASSENFHPDDEPFKDDFERGSARDRATARAAALILYRPELWDGLTLLLAREDKLYLLEDDIRNVRILPQPLNVEATQLLIQSLRDGWSSPGRQKRHRAARMAYLATTTLGVQLDFVAIEAVLNTEADPHVKIWLSMCAMDLAPTEADMISSFERLASTHREASDNFQRDRIYSCMTRAAGEKSFDFDPEMLIEAFRLDPNTSTLRYTARAMAMLAPSRPHVAERLAEFLATDPLVNGLGRTKLFSFRKEAKGYFTRWMQAATWEKVAGLVAEIPNVDIELAIMLADACLHSVHRDQAAALLQDAVSASKIDPEVSRAVAGMLRVRIMNVQPLLLDGM